MQKNQSTPLQFLFFFKLILLALPIGEGGSSISERRGGGEVSLLLVLMTM